MKKIICVLSAICFTVSAVVLAHGGATGVVKERMDLMDTHKDAMKTLKPVFRGNTDYDVTVIKENALVIRDNAAEHMTKLFPEGSLDMPSEALPAIWEQWQEFERLANNLQRLGQALYDGAENTQKTSPRTGMGGPGMMGNYEGMGPQGMSGPGMMGNHQGMGLRGSSPMYGLDNMTNEQLAAMPAAGLFQMISQNCAACHKNFRVEK
ncbi:MAG: cytochrome c556 [Cellvibrionaceae bacterium]|jgi:cytochrome c556